MAKEAVQSADTATPEKKKRAPQVRKPKILNALIAVNEDGNATVLIASYDAFKLLKAVKQYPDATLVEITPA